MREQKACHHEGGCYKTTLLGGGMQTKVLTRVLDGSDVGVLRSEGLQSISQPQLPQNWAGPSQRVIPQKLLNLTLNSQALNSHGVNFII